MTFASSARSSKEIRAFGLPLSSRSALEQPIDFHELSLPSPPPPLRDGVTEVHFSRWVVEEANKEIGDATREDKAAQKAVRKDLIGKFMVEQHRKVEDTHHQMAAASAAVETVRIKKLETGQEMRLNILQLKQAIHLEKEKHSAKGRELVEHAKNIQSSKVVDRQLSARGRRQEVGGQTKKERQRLTEAREAATHADEERKRQNAERVKQETAKETIAHSTRIIEKERIAIGSAMRSIEEQNAVARTHARERFASQSARSRREVEAARSGAKSAREGLATHRRQEADAIRAAREAEKQRKKELQEEVRARNRQIHDLLYASKFAPRERAKKVNLPGRVSKTAFNAFDAEAAAADAAAAAPAMADPFMMGGLAPQLGAGGFGGGAGMLGGGGRRASSLPGGAGESGSVDA